MTQLTERQKLILARALDGMDIDDWIRRIEAGALSFPEIEFAVDALSNEFHMKGIDEKFEATSYGKEVEAVLDVVNRPRLR